MSIRINSNPWVGSSLNVKTIGLKPQRTISCKQAFSGIIKSGSVGDSGPANAFAFSVLRAFGVDEPIRLIRLGGAIDQLVYDINAIARPKRAWTEMARIGRIKDALWRIAPDRYAKPNKALFDIGAALENYSSGPVGDCVTLTTIDNIVLQMFGIPIGVVLESSHVYSITSGGATIENTVSDFSAATRRHKGKRLEGKVYNSFALIACAFNCRGNDFASRGFYDYAKKAFEAALSICPDYSTIYNNLAGLLWAMMDYDGAEKHFNCAIVRDPSCAYYYVNRALFYLDRGNYVWAKRDFNTAYRMDPYNPDLASVFRQHVSRKPT